MGKAALLVTFFLFISSSGKSRSSPDQSPILAYYISKQCGIDSTIVKAIIARMHGLFKIRRVEFVKSSTEANYYLAGGILRMNLKDTNRMCEMWIAELAHAEQFSTQPIKYGLITARDGIRTICSMFFLKKSECIEIKRLRKNHCPFLKAWFWTVWQRNYHRPGTMEYDAHEIIEKRLLETINSLFYDPHQRVFFFPIEKGTPNLGPLY